MTLDDPLDGDLSQEQVMALVAAAEARKSKMIALLIAIAAHVVLVGGLVYAVFARPLPPEPTLIIAAPSSPVEQLQPRKKELVQVKAQRPSASSSSMAKVTVADTASPIAVPLVEDFPEEFLELGAGFGEGLGTGLGMGGNGLGGSFFGTPATGKSVILVIDVSTSMLRNCGERGIEAIRSEINRTINAFRPGSRFNIICFGNNADAFKKKSVAATSGSKADAIAFMRDYYKGDFTRTRTGDGVDEKDPIPYVPIRPSDLKSTRDTSGGSRYDMALLAAFEQRPDTIFLLTDGEPSTSRDGERLSKREILTMVRKAGKRAYGSKTPRVNGISVNGIGKGYLEDIARTYNGKVKVIEPKKL